MGGSEQKFVNEAFATNWIAPLGPNVNGFENDLKNYLGGGKHVAALSSGTAAIHLALQLLDVSQGDEVLCQSFTFSASANPIIYQGATPVFIDSESDTWNMSPELLEIAIKDRIEKYKKPKVIIAVHLYGMPYKVNEINAIAKKYDIPVIEDSAEALGSTYFNQECGALSDMGILSFNEPPIPLPVGSMRPSAALAAMAASTALPPAFRISSAICVASGWLVAAIPCGAIISEREACALPATRS